MLISYNRTKISQNYQEFYFSAYNELYQYAQNKQGLDWNYIIAPYLDRDIHEKLLEVTQQEMAQIIETVTMILSLIRSGYFYTASVILNNLDVSNSSKLTEIKTWLMKSLLEADDTEEV